ncbi:MAG: SdiA-regulated domain-containing protein [Ginsengibacter sp.]
MKKYLFNTIFFLFFFIGCSNNSNKNRVTADEDLSEISIDSSKETNHKTDYQYDLKKPKRTWQLPSALLEVSGNTWVDKNHLLLIDDRHPNLYLIKIDDKNAVLEKTIPFQDDEKDKFDIEDVTIFNDVVYALWSHGVLFKISNWNSKPDVKEIPTFLSKENNTEGLCYDPITKSLLIACKYASGIKDEDKSTKAVYQFDMATEKLDEKPFLIIHKKDFEKLAGHKLVFYPSAIAVHPITHNIYLLSTRDNKCMTVFSREGVLISFQFIDENLMPQPEGICFSPEGKLYISSEGKNGSGKLLEFEVK